VYRPGAVYGEREIEVLLGAVVKSQVAYVTCRAILWKAVVDVPCRLQRVVIFVQRVAINCCVCWLVLFCNAL